MLLLTENGRVGPSHNAAVKYDSRYYKLDTHIQQRPHLAKYNDLLGKLNKRATAIVCLRALNNIKQQRYKIPTTGKRLENFARLKFT